MVKAVKGAVVKVNVMLRAVSVAWAVLRAVGVVTAVVSEVGRAYERAVARGRSRWAKREPPL